MNPSIFLFTSIETIDIYRSLINLRVFFLYKLAKQFKGQLNKKKVGKILL